ncbi:hypothetical protein [Acinetobacter indicus]|uniref:hypothetical protein n=1 Tax=Acinetobacter indicus TaxID=756892 RepID=UPI001443BCF3|nr:hypothetical protein [Acinetobacter indicus]
MLEFELWERRLSLVGWPLWKEQKWEKKQLGKSQEEAKPVMALLEIERATRWELLQWAMVLVPVRERLSSSIPA